MNCYKSGGCGVYENRSCYECPASKIEYLKRKEWLKKLEESLKKRDKFIEDIESCDYQRLGVFGFSISIPKTRLKK